MKVCIPGLTLSQPTFERPPCAGRPPYGKTHSGSSNHRKIYEILFVFWPERLKVLCEIQSITKAILPAPHSVKSNVLSFRLSCHIVLP
jgi:hypothetical protein